MAISSLSHRQAVADRSAALERDERDLAKRRIAWTSDHPSARAHRQRYGLTNTLPVRNDQDYLSEEEAEGRRFGMEENSRALSHGTARYKVFGVRLNAYRNQDVRSALLHVCVVDAAGDPVAVLCKRVKLENIFNDRSEIEDPPDCPVCVAKLATLTPNASSTPEWVKGSGVDGDGHNLTWWKNKVAKWKSQWDRPTVFIQVLCWDHAGARAREWPQFDPGELKEAKAYAKDFIERTGGSCQVAGRIEIPHQGSVNIELGEWKNTASNGFYVWSVDGETQIPVTRRGPFVDYEEALTLAKQAVRGGGTYDEVITFGGDPEAPDFSIEKAFKAWSGEVHYASDLPRVGGRLREYR